MVITTTKKIHCEKMPRLFLTQAPNNIICRRILWIHFGGFDIRGGYTQSGEAKRKMYVKLPSTLGRRFFSLLLLSTDYGIVSADLKGQLNSDEDMKIELKLEVVVDIAQLFIRREKEVLILSGAKCVDNILIESFEEEWLNYCRDVTQKCYEVSGWKQYTDLLQVNETKVSQDVYGLKIHSMQL